MADLTTVTNSTVSPGIDLAIESQPYNFLLGTTGYTENANGVSAAADVIDVDEIGGVARGCTRAGRLNHRDGR